MDNLSTNHKEMMLCNTRTQTALQAKSSAVEYDLNEVLGLEALHALTRHNEQISKNTTNSPGEQNLPKQVVEECKFPDFDTLLSELRDKEIAKENRKLFMKKQFDNRKKPKRVHYVWYIKNGGETDEKKLPADLSKELEISLIKKTTFTRHDDPLFPSANATYDPQAKTVTVMYFLQPKQVIKLKRKVMVQGIPVKIPKHWEPSQQYICQIFDVPSSSPEFQSIEQAVHETLPLAKISKIERVQNLAIYCKYFSEAWYIAERNNGLDNQMQLFHGTRTVKPGLIVNNSEGFDARLSTNNNLWGPGAYFATKASYADLYAYKGVGDDRVIILASVALGSCYDYGTLCNPSLKSPPINTVTKRKHDSICGKTRDTCVYAVYNPCQAYPRYMITYSVLGELANSDATNYPSYPTFPGVLTSSSSSI